MTKEKSNKMKRQLFSIALIFLFAGAGIMAQEKEPDFGIQISGFVKNDFFWDSRQTVAAREGHFLLWPSPELMSTDNLDINAQAGFNFLAIQSRLKATVTGPDAFGAKTSAVIEGDFFAQSDANINLLRLRHAMIKLNWQHTEILTGQYWNPLFVTSCFPGTVSFNTGTPLQSFARNPQVRLTQTIGSIKIVAAALAQRDFSSRGPDPADPSKTMVSSTFLRNSRIPDLHLQAHYHSGNAESGKTLDMGVGIAWKTITPRLSSATGYRVKESVSGITALAFSKLTLTPITIKLQGRYGENIADVLSISGFAVKAIEDPVTGQQSYTPLQNITVWGEIHTNGKKVQAGLMGGILRNLGTKETMSDPGNPVYGLGTNIAFLYRVSPRVVFISNKTKLALEVEYTTAGYGTGHDLDYLPQSIQPVTNLRGLMSAIYAF